MGYLDVVLMRRNPSGGLNLLIGLTYRLFVGVVGCGLLLVAFFLGKTARKSRDSLRRFECGFQAMKRARIPFSFKFYLLAIIFLLFDLEIVLVLPYFIRVGVGGAQFFLFIFFRVLLWGLIHECAEGSLDWD